MIEDRFTVCKVSEKVVISSCFAETHIMVDLLFHRSLDIFLPQNVKTP